MKVAVSAVDNRNVPFARTTCACAEDVASCYRTPGPLGPGDFNRIGIALNQPAAVVEQFLRRSDGTVVKNSMTGRSFRLFTVVPMTVPDGGATGHRCVFLDAQRRCRIHSDAPFGCAYYDVHQPPAESSRRSLWMLRAIEKDADYQALLRRVKPR